MTHIIMSGAIKPLTEVELAFARMRHQQIRATTPRKAPNREYIIIRGELFVSIKEAARLTGYDTAYVWQKVIGRQWHSMHWPGFVAKHAVRLRDIFSGGVR